MRSRFVLTLVGFLSVISSCGKPKSSSKGSDSQLQEAWNSANVPTNFEGVTTSKFFDLPLAGKLTKTPWTDTYWPSYRGGIASRWNDPSVTTTEGHHTYALLTKEKALTLSGTELRKLSPAEKYDLFSGRYDFPTVARERQRVSPEDPTWTGICHGWAPAAINFNEPKEITLSNPDGIAVPFGSSDVKALLSYYEGEISNTPSRSLSKRCNFDFKTNPDAKMKPECRDTNAGTFHLALTNLIGLKNQGFVADLTRDMEVWNQPIHTYESRIEAIQGPSANAAAGTNYEVVVTTLMTYTVEINPTWLPVLGTSGHANRTATYHYRLELSSADEIIGGVWLDETLHPSLNADRPDFLWTEEQPDFSEEYKDLKSIATASGALPLVP